MNLQLVHQLSKDNQFGKYRSMLRLLVLGHVLCLISATASGITHRPSDADKLQTNYGFGDLKAVNLDYGTFTKRAILRIQEDRYNPGSYFLMHLGFIFKYTPGQPTTLFLGNPEQTEFKRYVSGNSSVAEFSAVSDIIQYNRTKYALSDYLNNCVREYDSDTDIVTPLVGDCIGDHRTSIGSLNPGDSVAGDSNFLTGVLDIELVESGNYFIMCDQGYEQITTYDVITGQVELLLSGQDLFSLPGPTSLLLNSDSTYLYVSHSNGLSKVNLDTRAVTLLVGESKFSIGGQVAALSTGTFDEATISPMNSLTWLVPDKVLLAASDTNHALVVMDLVKEIVLGSCVGSTEFNTSLGGSQESCRLNRPTAAIFSNNTIYITSITEGEYSFFSDSSLYRINVDIDSYNNTDVLPDTVTSDISNVNNDTSNILCSECPVQISVGNLEEVKLNLNGNPRRPIDFMVEDIYQPGTFYFNSAHTILKFTPGKPVEHFVGKDYQGASRTDERYKAGNSSTAEFSLISSVVQFNETIMLIGDYLNNCVREYNMVTDYISQFIGSCNGTFLESRKILAGDVFSPDRHFLSGLLKVVIVKSHGYLLMLDHGYGLITKYDFNAKTVQLLGDNLHDHLPNPRDILLNLDESEMFVAHSYGLTRVNLDSLKTTLLVGKSVNDANGGRDLPFSPGSFAKASVGYIESIQWLVPNQLIVTIGTQSNEALVFIDLEGEQIYTVCVGSEENNKTITGPPDTCKLNAPTGMMVAADDSIYISTLTDVKYKDYSFNTGSSIFRIKIKVSLCKFEAPTGNEIVSPSAMLYNQYKVINVTCPPGMGLNSSSNRRECVDNSKWSEPLPHCLEVTSGDAISDLSPKVGQISGGTLVTAVGIIPDSGVEVHLNNSDGLVIPLDFTVIPQKLSFRMPNQSRVGSAELIIKLAENVTTTYTFMYEEDPVLNDTVQSATIVSGGFNASFLVTNINSSSDYTLTTRSNNNSYKCVQDRDTVRCDVKNFSDNDNASNPRYLPIQLFSDGILMGNSDNISLAVYADPVFKKETISLSVGETLTLRGSNLDVGILNQYYVIQIELEAGELISCEVKKITNNNLECQPLIDDLQLNSDPKAVFVIIGDLHMNPVSAVFLPSTTTTTTSGSVLKTGSIAAISVFTVLSVIAVIVVFIVCHRRRETARRLNLLHINSMSFTKENNDWFVSLNIELKAKLDPLLIKPDTLKLKEGAPIGQGNFGTIYLGQMYSGDVVKTVAIKTLKEMESSIPMIEKFLEEAVILQDFSHANVLQTLGVCIPESDKPQVILPYMANGDLKSLIQMEHMQFSIGDLMHFAKQIASGMEYLASNKFIHRDLAARNCLVSDKYIVRIADFGLSKDIYSNDYYRRDEKSEVALPIKWLALESLRTGKFSTESDVWSYGVLMWELCTRGSQPYPDVDAWDVRAYLEEGRRLHQPSFCPPVVWEVMQSCWFESVEERPTFTMIYDFLNKLLEGTECSPQSPYSYIREYTKDIPINYVQNPVEVEPQEYLIPVPINDRMVNDYLAAC